MLSLLTVQSREDGAFQDTEIIFDFVGVSAEAEEQVMMVHCTEFSLFVEGKGRRGDHTFRRDVTHGVIKHSQYLHLRRTEERSKAHNSFFQGMYEQNIQYVTEKKQQCDTLEITKHIQTL